MTSHAGLTIARHVLDVTPQRGSAWQPCESSLDPCRRASSHPCCSLWTSSCPLTLLTRARMPSLCLAVCAHTRARHRGRGHHCRRCKLHRCSLSFAVAAPSHAVHAPHRCRATAPPCRSRCSTDAPVRRSCHRLAAGARGQGATASLKPGRAALGVRRHARRAARLPLAAGAAPPRRNRPFPTAPVSLPCSLYEEEEEGPTCKRETSSGGFL
jgi:hypothetical protein